MLRSRFTGPAIAILIAVSFVLWMLSGHDPDKNPSRPAADVEKSLIPGVQVVTSEARTVAQSLTVNGITEANRFVNIRSEVSGKIIEIKAANGQQVASGDLIARIDAGDIPARIRQAKAQIDQTRLEYEGAVRLGRQALLNEAQVAARLAAYEQARAQLDGLERQYAHTFLRAPFNGQIESLNVEIGSFVRPGDAIADLYDYSALTFIGAVAEKDIALLQLGQAATVELISGDRAQATVSYIASVTNPATRTFKVELTVAEFDSNVSGVTSEANIQLADDTGHFISPALLFINDAGEMGLKALNEQNQVVFYQTDIIHSEPDGVWVSGLPNTARIIIVGQGFVAVGDTVNPTEVSFNADVAVGL